MSHIFNTMIIVKIKFNSIRRLSYDTNNYFGKNTKTYIKDLVKDLVKDSGKNSNIIKSSNRVKISDIGNNKTNSCLAVSSAGSSCIISSYCNTDTPCNRVGGDNKIDTVTNMDEAHVSYDWWESTFR